VADLHWRHAGDMWRRGEALAYAMAKLRRYRRQRAGVPDTFVEPIPALQALPHAVQVRTPPRPGG
jgi:hypothetical protein